MLKSTYKKVTGGFFLRTSGSSPIHPGRASPPDKAERPTEIPSARATYAGRPAAFPARSIPTARAITAKAPMPPARNRLEISHTTLVVIPTAAKVSAPRRPTITESAYCTTVCRNCSTTVGQASSKITLESCLQRRGHHRADPFGKSVVSLRLEKKNSFFFQRPLR